jgi:hypothetical protein
MPPFWPDRGAGNTIPPGLPREFFGSDPHEQMHRVSDHVMGIGRPRASSGKSE